MKTKEMLPPEGHLDATDWRRRCAELEVQRDQLQKQLAEVEIQRDRYLKAVYALTYKDFDIEDRESLVAVAKNGPSLREVVEKTKSMGH